MHEMNHPMGYKGSEKRRGERQGGRKRKKFSLQTLPTSLWFINNTYIKAEVA